jgi:hypothetical protein
MDSHATEIRCLTTSPLAAFKSERQVGTRSAAMTGTTTETYPQDATQPPNRGRGPLVAFVAAAVVLILIGVLGLLTATPSEEDPAQPEPQVSTTTATEGDATPLEPTTVSPAEVERVVTAFVAAMSAGDGDTASSLVVGATEGRGGFLDWLIALDTSGLEFFDCDYQTGSVSCTTTAGPGHFYERIHGEEGQSTFFADVVDGQLDSPT